MHCCPCELFWTGVATHTVKPTARPRTAVNMMNFCTSLHQTLAGWLKLSLTSKSVFVAKSEVRKVELCDFEYHTCDLTSLYTTSSTIKVLFLQLYFSQKCLHCLWTKGQTVQCCFHYQLIKCKFAKIFFLLKSSSVWHFSWQNIYDKIMSTSYQLN